ncbi:MAG: asparaginase [Candidatus Caenarcaniphilales bacterium]|nr:asparaginase [Candidatus Caenarcaniphilales bacterium]
MHPTKKLSILATGGTIATKMAHTEGRQVDITTFKNRISRKAVARISSPYFIISENTEANNIFKLVDALIRLIKTHKEKHILVTHGTDAMNEVLSIISDKDTAQAKHAIKKPGNLQNQINHLHKLIQKYQVKIVFTGANNLDDIEIKNNLDNSSKTLFDSNTPGPGIYLSFNGKLLEARSAYKERFREPLMTFTDFPMLNGVEKDEADVLVYRLNQVRFSPHDLLKQIETRKAEGQATRAIKFIFYHSSTANVNPESKYNAAELIKQVKEKYPEITLFGVTENAEPLEFGKYYGSKVFDELGVMKPYDYYIPRYDQVKQEQGGCCIRRCGICHQSGPSKIAKLARTAGIEKR